MSSNHDTEPEVVELSLQLANLSISVRGPSDQAAGFLRRIADTSTPAQPASSYPAGSSSSPGFQLAAPSEPSLEETFDPCPVSVLQSARSFLRSTRVAPEVRARRAWLAGQWARAVLSGRAETVPETPALDFPVKYWVVLRSSRCTTPRLFQTFAKFEREAGSLDFPGTLGHGFATETEAFFYLQSAGFKDQVRYYN